MGNSTPSTARGRRNGSATPKAIGYEHDFHKVDLGPDEDPMVIEKTLGTNFEGRWATVLREVLAVLLIRVGLRDAPLRGMAQQSKLIRVLADEIVVFRGDPLQEELLG
jgi:hypothetical protein